MERCEQSRGVLGAVVIYRRAASLLSGSFPRDQTEASRSWMCDDVLEREEEIGYVKICFGEKKRWRL